MREGKKPPGSYRVNIHVYCSIHATIALYIVTSHTHISFMNTVTTLTSTLIKSVNCYKKDYHEKTHVSTSALLLHAHNVFNKRHYFHRWTFLL